MRTIAVASRVPTGVAHNLRHIAYERRVTVSALIAELLTGQVPPLAVDPTMDGTTTGHEPNHHDQVSG